MKKAIVVASLLVMLLTGCGKWEPDLVYRPTSFKPDNYTIDLRDGYVLKPGHEYDIVEIEQGYDLVLHFVEGDVE